MIIQGKDISSDLRESADVCIIGSGCGGAAAAKILAESGKKVVVLEEGGYYAPGDFQQTEEWGFSNLYVQRAGLATTDLSTTVLQGRCVGGSSTINWTTSLRTSRFTLDHWVNDHGLTSLSSERLGPYFDRIESYLNIHAEPYERHNAQNRKILDGARALGYSAQANGRNVRDCAELGVCGMGCPIGGKTSADVTYVKDAIRAGATVISDAHALRIEMSGGRRIVSGDILQRETRERKHGFSIEATAVIVSASAITSPRLLASSGLGLSSNALGNNLTFHRTSAVLGVYDSPQQSWKGIPQSAMCDQFMNIDGKRGGFWVESAPYGPALAAMSVPSFGKQHAALMELLPYICVFIVLVNDTDSSGTVTSSDGGRPLISYRTGPRDSHHMRQAIEAGTRIHFAAGARSVFTLHTTPLSFSSPGEIQAKLRRAPWGPNDITMFSAHPLGTCRMGTDPRTSVVDPTGKVHDTPGVYVLDGSILPSSLSVNPQVTILAVVEKLAEGIADDWSSIQSS